MGERSVAREPVGDTDNSVVATPIVDGPVERDGDARSLPLGAGLSAPGPTAVCTGPRFPHLSHERPQHPCEFRMCAVADMARLTRTIVTAPPGTAETSRGFDPAASTSPASQCFLAQLMRISFLFTNSSAP